MKNRTPKADGLGASGEDLVGIAHLGSEMSCERRAVFGIHRSPDASGPEFRLWEVAPEW
jgi:hypothetical protein